jgi:molybdenum cofactor cytidylyltransferase
MSSGFGQTPVQSLHVGALVLAAGGSSRMGTAKQLLDFEGEPLVHRAVRTAFEADMTPIIVVLGSEADKVQAVLSDFSVDFVVNDDWADGLSTSIRVGVRRALEWTGQTVSCPAAQATGQFIAETEDHIVGFVLMVADQPNVTPYLLRELRECFALARAGGQPASVVLPSYQGRKGNPALFDITLLPRLEALRGDVGARQIFGELPLIELPQCDDHVFADIDTPEQYDAFRTR